MVDWLMKHMTNLERMTIVVRSWDNPTWDIVEGCTKHGKTTGCWEDAGNYCYCMWAWHDIFKMFSEVPRHKVFYGSVGEPHGGYDSSDFYESDSDAISNPESNSNGDLELGSHLEFMAFGMSDYLRKS